MLCTESVRIDSMTNLTGGNGAQRDYRLSETHG